MTFRLCLVTAASVLFSAAPSRAGDTNLEAQVQLLREQNAMLQQQLQRQRQSLDALTQKVQGLAAANTERENAAAENSAPAKSGFNLGKVILSGEGGVGFQKTGSQGFSPNSSFTVEEARLFLDAPVWTFIFSARWIWRRRKTTTRRSISANFTWTSRTYRNCGAATTS
jgi:hypothetical protein